MVSKSKRHHTSSLTTASKNRRVEGGVKMSWKKGKKSVLTSPKLTVEVYQGDLTLENTAAIVSTSNRRLKHEIGVAFALALAAGPELQAESDEWVSANGWLEVSEVAVTGAGLLAGRGVSHILHTVSPCFEDDAVGDETLAEQQLRVVYANCLHNAKALSLASIAFPGLSTGMLRVPAKVSAKAAIGALLEAAQADELGDINLVRFVDLAESTVKAFARELFDNRSMLSRHEWSIEEKEDNCPTLAAISSSTQKGLSFRATRSSTKNKNDENRNDLTEGDVSDEEGEEVEEEEIEEGEEVEEKELDEYFNTAVNDSSNNRLGDGLSSSGVAPPSSMPVNNDEEDKACPVCMEDFSNATSEDPIQKLEKCGHSFHQSCIQETFKHTQPQCPICKTWYGIPKGNQPRGSTMKFDKIKGAVPGFDCKEHIRISYYIPGGIQGKEHLRPGKPFTGTHRMAFLPYNDEGRLVLKLLKLAFDHRLTFTVGDSITTGAKNVVVWNNIHHKTSLHGGPQCFGYPDPTYLSRVQEELHAAGITKDMVK